MEPSDPSPPPSPPRPTLPSPPDAPPPPSPGDRIPDAAAGGLRAESAGTLAAASEAANAATSARRAGWVGAWTVVYGCVILAKSAVAAVVLGLLVASLRWSVAEVRLGAADSPDPATLEELSAVIERAPEALGAGRRPFLVTAALCALVAMIAGFRTQRGRATAARIAFVAVAACALLGAAMTVAEVASIDARLAWAAEATSVLDTVQRRGNAGPDVVAMLVGGSRSAMLLRSVGPHLLHLGLAGALAFGLWRAARRTGPVSM